MLWFPVLIHLKRQNMDIRSASDDLRKYRFRFSISHSAIGAGQIKHMLLLCTRFLQGCVGGVIDKYLGSCD